MPRQPPKSPYQAYEGTQRSAQPRRQAEALAFTRAARALEEAGDRAALEAALKKNQLLWTMVEAECRDPGNRLPREVTDNLVALAQLVDRQTVKALASGVPGDVQILVDIDRDIAQGLLGVPDNT